MAYVPRLVDTELQELLSAAGAVLIEGPKGCGKTATARQAASSEVLLDEDAIARQRFQIDPLAVLEGASPRLIDEWQVEPGIWNAVRRAVDNRGEPGQFILTGSAVPADEVSRHSGAGRFLRLTMRPMSLAEQGYSNGAISLNQLFLGTDVVSGDPGLSVAEIARVIARGGWPALRNVPDKAAYRLVRGYIDEIRRTDISRVDGISRDPHRVGSLLYSLGRNVATYASISTLAADVGGEEPLARQTTVEYLHALERIMVVEDQPPWAPNLRSRSRIRGAVKRHFVDPSLAIAAVGATAEDLLTDPNWFGFLFESMVIRDLRIYAQLLDGEVRQYRDSSGLEVDAIVELRSRKWAAFEIKLGHGYIEQAAQNLIKFASNIDTSRTQAPAALCVITGTGYGYRRPDGVYVIPIGAFCP